MQLEFNFFIFMACKWDMVPLKALQSAYMNTERHYYSPILNMIEMELFFIELCP